MSLKSSIQNFLKEFEAFAVKGNVIDLAVAVVIGGAFGTIVSSFVADIITPLMSLLTSNVNFTDARLVLREGENGSAPLALTYGNFIQAIINFLIISFSIFLAVKLLNTLRKKHDQKASDQPVAKTAEVELLEEIRDLLKKDKNPG